MHVGTAAETVTPHRAMRLTVRMVIQDAAEKRRGKGREAFSRSPSRSRDDIDTGRTRSTVLPEAD